MKYSNRTTGRIIGCLLVGLASTGVVAGQEGDFPVRGYFSDEADSAVPAVNTGSSYLDSAEPTGQFAPAASQAGNNDVLSGASGASQSAPSGGGELASKILDPTASLTQLVFQDRWISRFHQRDRSQNTLVFQPVIPFKVFGKNHILRATLPYRADGPWGPGLDPVQIFDLVVAPFGKGRIGVGGIMNFSPATTANADTFQMGPAVGWVGKKGKLTYGVFNQNLFSDDVGISFLQPVLGYTLSDKLTISAGDLQLGYDWKSTQWTSLPIGFQVNRIVNIKDTSFRLFYNPQYNFRDLAGTPEWTHIFGVALLVP